MCDKFKSPNLNHSYVKNSGCVECIEARIANCLRWAKILRDAKPGEMWGGSIYKTKAIMLEISAAELKEVLR